jgi:5-methylthioadenosine/S-adenosylhomocysteine deaminase
MRKLCEAGQPIDYSLARREFSHVDTLIVAGKIRKWKGQLLDVDLLRLRRELESSRDYLFGAAGVKQDLFRS